MTRQHTTRMVAVALTVGLLASSVSTAHATTTAAQYAVRVPGVMVAFTTTTAQFGTITTYGYTLTFPGARAVRRSGYTFYLGPVGVRPSSPRGRELSAQLHEAATGVAVAMWSTYQSTGDEGRETYQHIVRMGRPLVLATVQLRDAGTGTTSCDLVYAGSRAFKGFALSLWAGSTCAGAENSAVPVLDALLRKMS